MAELDVALREITDGLDALGNTTAATRKSFSIDSAVLATLVLLTAFKKEADLPGIDITIVKYYLHQYLVHVYHIYLQH